MRARGSEVVSLSLLFLLLSLTAAQYQYYDEEDQVSSHSHSQPHNNFLKPHFDFNSNKFPFFKIPLHDILKLSKHHLDHPGLGEKNSQLIGTLIFNKQLYDSHCNHDVATK